MKFYNTFDKFDFGIYKGETISDVYKFDPGYIDWCLVNIDKFFTNIQILIEQGYPTPMTLIEVPQIFLHKPEAVNMPKWINGLKIGNKVTLAKKYLSEGNKLESSKYEFSEVAKRKYDSSEKLIKIINTVSDLKQILKSQFENDLLNISLLTLKEKGNKLSVNNFAFSMLELTRHILERLAPQQNIKNCSWYKKEAVDVKVTMYQRLRYVIQGGLPTELLSKLGFDVRQITKQIEEIKLNFNSLYNYIPINQDVLNLSENTIEIKRNEFFSIFMCFISKIETYREQLKIFLTKLLEEVEVFSVLSDNFEYIDRFEMPENCSISSFELIEYYVSEISDEYIYVSAGGIFSP